MAVTLEGDEVRAGRELAGYVDRVPGGWQASPCTHAVKARWFADQTEAVRYVADAHAFACVVIPGYRR